MSSARATRSTRRRVAFALGAGLALSLGAVAQAEIPLTVSRSSSISGAQSGQIEAHIAQLTEAVQGDAIARAKSARDALLEPLNRQDVSAAFRQSYARSLAPLIDELIGGDDALQQLTGLRLAGAAADQASIEALTDTLSSEDDGVRMFAIGRLERALGTIGTPSGVLVDNAPTQRAVSELAALVRDEESPRMADAAARALAPVTRITSSELVGLRQRAVQSLSEAAGDRLNGLDHRRVSDQEMAAAIRATAFIRLAVADPNTPPTREAAIAATRLGGDALGLVLAVIRSGGASDDRTLLVQLTQAAETAVYFGRFSFARAGTGDVSAIQQTTLGSLVEGAEDGQFRNDVIRLLGPASSVVRDMGLDADRFIRDI